MTYYLAANDRTLAVICSDGSRMRLTFIHLKKHPLSNGLTKAQAAVRLMSLIANHGERVPGRFETLNRILNTDTEVRLRGLFFNEPPQSTPIVHAQFFSLDSTSVENWLRKVFGKYRECLPPIVSSLQQELENWTGLRWITNRDIPGDILEQAELAEQTHIGIWEAVAERQARQRNQGAMQ